MTPNQYPLSLPSMSAPERNNNASESLKCVKQVQNAGEFQEASLNNVQSQTFFPLKLHRIISDECNTDIIRWLPSGKAFIIADKKRFAAEILPRFFSQACKFTSFTRKLTRWHFRRIPRGPLIGAYYHDLFLRNQEQLCYQMVCKVETTGSKSMQLQSISHADRARISVNLQNSTSTQQRSLPPLPTMPVNSSNTEQTILPPLQPLYAAFDDPRKNPMMYVANPNPLVQPDHPQFHGAIEIFSHSPNLKYQQNDLLGSRLGEILVVEEGIRKLEQAREQQENTALMNMYQTQLMMDAARNNTSNFRY